MRSGSRALLLLFSVFAPAALGALPLDLASAVATADADRLATVEERLVASVTTDPAGLAPEDFGTAADVFGKLVGRARDLGVGEAQFASLAAAGERLREACRAKVRDLERATGEDETALEALYRSDRWYEINHALSAFGYWRAWALLGAAQARPSGPERIQLLHRAEAGFKATSVRILYPGLVQGSWLGLGYVELARDHVDAARRRFERLVQALADRPDNEVRKLAETELTLLAVRRGEAIEVAELPKEPLSPTRAAVVAEEAFALLERRRRENIGAMPAGERLRKLIDDGYLSDGRLARILAYRDEIVGEDLGVISRLIDAEFAYAYEQYKTTVIKYREFREQGGERLPLDISPFHYHYVIALLRTGLPREARLELERLRRGILRPEVAAALPKLEWLIAEAIYDQHPTEVNREAFERSAAAFVATAPDDRDAAAAHLGLARAGRDPRAAARHLRVARTDPTLRAGVALTALHRAISDFNRATARGDAAEQERVARSILASLGDLPKQQRSEPWQRALALQMRAVLGEDPVQILAAIDAMLAEFATDTRVRPVLLWARLRVLAATRDNAGLIAMAEQIAARGADAEGERQFYQFLLELERKERFALVATLAEYFAPALTGQGSDQRQLGLLRIRAAAALGDAEGAFAIARDLVQTFPSSGDAWRAYAEVAERAGRRFEADRGWAQIAAATPVGSPPWRDAILHRLALADSGGDVCALVARLGVYRHLLAGDEKAALISAEKSCPRVSG